MVIAPSIVRRMSRNVLIGALAVAALLVPALTPFAPDLAGRLPNHGHIYAQGVAVPHTHPGDDPAAHHGGDHVEADGGAAEATVIFTVEDLGLFASAMPPALVSPPATPDPVAAPAAPDPMRPGSVRIAPRPHPPQA